MTNSNENAEDQGAYGAVRGSLMAVAGAGLVVTTLAAVLEIGSPLGVLVGALVATANLWVLARVVNALLKPAGARASWGAVATLKFLALVVGLFLLVQRGFTDPLSLILGYAALPIGIVVAQLSPLRTANGEAARENPNA